MDTIICQVAIHRYILPPPSPVHCLIDMLVFVAIVVIVVHHLMSLPAIKVDCVCVCVCLTSSREGLPSDAIPIAG